MFNCRCQKLVCLIPKHLYGLSCLHKVQYKMQLLSTLIKKFFFTGLLSLHVKQMCALTPISFQPMQIRMKLKIDVATNDTSHDHI